MAAVISAWCGIIMVVLVLIGWSSWREDFMLDLRQGAAEWLAPAPVGEEEASGEDRKDNLTRFAETQCESGPFIATFQGKKIDLCAFVTEGVAATIPGLGTAVQPSQVEEGSPSAVDTYIAMLCNKGPAVVKSTGRDLCDYIRGTAPSTTTGGTGAGTSGATTGGTGAGTSGETSGGTGAGSGADHE